MKNPLRAITPGSRLSFAFFLVLHLACFGAIWTGVPGEALILMLALFWLRLFGITAGFHRYFAHRAFKTGRVFQFILALLGQMSLQRSVIWWAAKHREHHRDSDTVADAHSPVQHGFWFAHMGWIFNDDVSETDYARVPDLTAHPEIRWLDRNQYLPGILLGLGCYLWMGWAGLVVGFCWSTVLTYHATFAINSLAHVIGRQRYLTGDESKNNWFLALLTLGEGWHNNHHYYMASARQGFFWWEVDISYYILRLLAVFGIVWDLKQPPARILQGERELAEHLRERVAGLLAQRFSVEDISARIRARLDALHLADGMECANERLHQVMHAELPSFEEIRHQAARIFARTEALAEIAGRARERLALAVSRELGLEPVPA